MQAAIATAGWEQRAAALTAELITAGVLPDPAWARAFTEVPRHVFVPRVLADDRTTVIPAGAPGWLDLVYSDEALLTQATTTGQGVSRQNLPTSSSSRPRVMAVMLDRLATRPGHRVLEIGTGTGYNTALLGHRLGAGNVYSIDLDPHLVDSARAHLADVGQHPQLAPGDGARGWPEHAPFDRILATCAIGHVPPAWIDQLAEGGQIIAPLDAGEAGPLLVLTKTAPQEVSGRIDPYPVHFMPMREHLSNPLGPGPSTGFTATGSPHYGTTALDPATLLATGRTNLALFLWLHAPGLRIAGGADLGKVYVNTATALAEATLTPNEDGIWPVTQRGSCRLWDTIEHGYATWLALGQPGPARLGVTARNSEDDQYVWLDDPEGTHIWPLIAPSARK
ncbi:MAG TPA: methyltransferase domain-containing protein [Pseudonocardiaceae bacterium]|jgi:protein-L-isoaspartate(D-aspartate) O-methyltransferase|nr:methyltransferase domain-containing protein [Pseudonocardiaceae bacterium]